MVVKYRSPDECIESIRDFVFSWETDSGFSLKNEKPVDVWKKLSAEYDPDSILSTSMAYNDAYEIIERLSKNSKYLLRDFLENTQPSGYVEITEIICGFIFDFLRLYITTLKIVKLYGVIDEEKLKTYIDSYFEHFCGHHKTNIESNLDQAGIWRKDATLSFPTQYPFREFVIHEFMVYDFSKTTWINYVKDQPEIIKMLFMLISFYDHLIQYRSSYVGSGEISIRYHPSMRQFIAFLIATFDHFNVVTLIKALSIKPAISLYDEYVPLDDTRVTVSQIADLKLFAEKQIDNFHIDTRIQ